MWLMVAYIIISLTLKRRTQFLYHIDAVVYMIIISIDFLNDTKLRYYPLDMSTDYELTQGAYSISIKNKKMIMK